MTQHELDAIILSGEGYKVEFKQAVNSDLAKEIVAFANASGGRIFIGIADNGTVPGIIITNKLRSEIQGIARSCDPPVNVQLGEFSNKFMIINVPEGTNKPYRCTSGFYLRIGASSIKMTTQQILDFFKSEGRVKFDELENMSVSYPADKDDDLIKRFMELASINTTLNHDELLANLGVLYKEDGKTVVSNAAVLFFAENTARLIPHSVISCVAYKGNRKVDIIDQKNFNADIISNIDDALAFLKRHLNVSFEIRGKQRKENLELPEIVLREALVNAVAHRDYFEKGANVMVEVFDNRIEISNPGGLPKGMTEKDFGTRTLARNPLIASLLNRARYIEKLGTGIPRIRQAMQDIGLPEPAFSFDSFFTITLRRYNPVAEIRKNLKVSEGKGNRIAKILELLAKGEKLEPEKLSGELDATARTIRNDIDTLQAAGWVSSTGTTYAREYALTDAGREVAGKYF